MFIFVIGYLPTWVFKLIRCCHLPVASLLFAQCVQLSLPRAHRYVHMYLVTCMPIDGHKKRHRSSYFFGC